jgi:hypothetical protein
LVAPCVARSLHLLIYTSSSIIVGLFGDFITQLGTNVLEKIRKAAVMYSDILARHFPGRTEENYRKYKSKEQL